MTSNNDCYCFPASNESISDSLKEKRSKTEESLPDSDPKIASVQIIYLDFDGELTSYRNAELDLDIDGVQVADSRLSRDRIAEIVDDLNARFAEKNVVFVTSCPKNAAYSTIFIGKTSAFDMYGDFIGLSETVDKGNLNHSDNAFVNLDAAESNAALVDAISHESEHLLGMLDHGGDGLDRFAGYITYYLTSFSWELGFSDNIPAMTFTNVSDKSSKGRWTNNITYYVSTSYYGSYSKVPYSITVPSGGPGETTAYKMPSVQTVLSALGISPKKNMKYSDVFQTYYLEQDFEASGGGTGSDDVTHTLKVVPSGVVLFQASSLATGSGSTSYTNAYIKDNDQLLSLKIIGQGEVANLAVGFSDSATLYSSTITSGGRAEFDQGTIELCSVENGGVITLSGKASANSCEINKDGTLYTYSNDFIQINDLTVHSGGKAYLTAGTTLSGSTRIESGGSITIQGATKKKTDEQCDVIFDISQNTGSSTVTMVDGLKYLPTGTTITINASGKQQEGTYLLATGLDANSMPKEISFTIDGKTVVDSTDRPWKFSWDAEQGKYTGITYKGMNYILKNDAGNLTLTLDKSEFNLYFFISAHPQKEEDTDAFISATNFFENQLKSASLSDNVNMFVVVDHIPRGEQDNIYRIIGGAGYQKFTTTVTSKSFAELLGYWTKDIKALDANNAVIYNSHGSGVSVNGTKVDALARTLLGKNISTMAFYPTCLMASIDTMYALSTACAFIVGSETLGWSNTVHYKDFLEELNETQNLPLSIYNSMTVYNAKNSRGSLLKNSTASNIVASLNKFAERFFLLSQEEQTEIAQFVLSAQSACRDLSDGHGNNMIDIKEFCNNLLKKTSPTGLLSLFHSTSSNYEIISDCLKSIINQATPLMTKGNDKWGHALGGISVYLPVFSNSGNRDRSDREIYESTMETINSAPLHNTSWGRFVKAIYNYSCTVAISTSNGLERRQLPASSSAGNVVSFAEDEPTGDMAYELGVFSGNAFLLENEALYYSGDVMLYAMTLAKDNTKSSRLCADSNGETNVKLMVFDMNSNVMAESESAQNVSVSLADLSAGDYIIAVSGDGDTMFSLYGEATWNKAADRFDEPENNNLKDAVELSESQYKMLLTSSSDPDYYYFSDDISFDGPDDANIVIWGRNLSEDSLSAAMLDGDGNLISNFVWDDENNRYIVSGSGEGEYLRVIGNSPAPVQYNISIIRDYDFIVPNVDYWSEDFAITVDGKDSRNFAAGRLNPGVYTLSGEFAEGLNATIKITDFITGKSVGTVQVKKGRIAKETSFLLNGSYLFSIAGDGKTSGDCLITIDGKVNNAADNSDDMIDSVRNAAASSFVSGSLGYGDDIDWIRTDIDAAGRYTVSLTGLDASAKATVTLWSSINGSAAKKVASKSATGKDIVLSDLLLPCDDETEYYVSVTCDNASSGVFTDYSLSISGDAYDSLYSDTSDNVLTPDLDEVVFRTGSRIDAATGTYLHSATVNGWVGYGDTADVMPFTVTTPAQWSISIKANKPKSVAMTLKSVSYDEKTGKYKYTDIAKGKADAKGTIKFSNMLQAGTYILTVNAQDAKNDKSNTDYSVTMDELSRFAVLNTVSGDLFSMTKGETKTFTLTSLMEISFNKKANMSLWTGDGKNGKKSVKLAYDKKDKAYKALLTPGTYFLTATKKIYDVSIVGCHPDGNYGTITPNNNRFEDATTSNGSESGFVGFGDGVDYYRFTVGNGYFAPGDYTFSLGNAVSKYVAVGIYSKNVSKGKVSYKQIGKFTHKTGESTSVTLKNLIDGDYYIKVESLSYSKESSSKNTSYKLSFGETKPYRELSLGEDLGSSTSVLAKGDYAYYLGTGDGSGVTVYKINARVKNGYEVYVNGEDGKLNKVNTFNDTFILNDDCLFYVKSTKNNRNYSQGISLSVITHDELDAAPGWYVLGPDENNLQRFGSYVGEDFQDGWYSEIGHLQASDHLDFYVGKDSAVSSGWGVFEITALDRSFGDTGTIKLTLSLERLKDGSWKKVSSVAAQSAYDRKSGSYVLSGEKLEAVVEDYSQYRISVSVSEKDAEKFLGKFTVSANIDAFTPYDASLADPTLLNWDVSGTVVKKYDETDVYDLDLDDIDYFYLDMDSGSAKLTFYDSDFNEVTLNGNYLTDTSGEQIGKLKNAVSATLKAGDSKSDGFMMSSSDLLDYGIRYARIDALGKANNHYHITTGNAL